MRPISYELANKIASVWNKSSSLSDAMEKAGVKGKDKRTHNKLRRSTEELLGITLPTHNPKYLPVEYSNLPRTSFKHSSENPYTLVIFSDAHFWPGENTPAFTVLCKVIDEIKPEFIIDNGDSFDGATISRHDPNMWETKPTLRQELDCVRQNLEEISASSKKSVLLRTMGNHDYRFEALLAKRVPELKDMPYTTISELFPGWEHRISHIFNGHTIVKHRWHSGIHAGFNNVLKAGINIVTGHTHVLEARAFRDYRGVRYGIQTGTLADPYGPQFEYCEDNPRNWQQGFAVLQIFPDHIIPELVEIRNGYGFFRGKSY